MIALSRALLLVTGLAVLFGPSRAHSADAAQAPHLDLAQDSPRVQLLLNATTGFYVGGYVETYYAWNFGQPQNGITEFRAFDNRHDTFQLQAMVLDVGFKSPSVEARLVAQAGFGPATYYWASEPTLLGTSLTPASDANLWRPIQQAWLAWSPVPNHLVVDAGLFLSPIGPENMPTYLNHHWSHSLLFFGLPFYNAGARVRWMPTKVHALRVGVYNGWNDATDNNTEKTLGVDYAYTPHSALTVGAAYFGGVERPPNAPEGRAWRNLLDVWVVWSPFAALSLLAEADGGVEPGKLGVSGWAAGNFSARLHLVKGFFAAARATWFQEWNASRNGVVASPIAIPANRIASGTLTIEAVPLSGLSFKLEGRYDNASSDTYFKGRVLGDGTPADPFVPNARNQSTLTLGATAWF